MKKDIYEITILNWEKYQPRKDLKRMHWFRLESSIIFDSKFNQLNAATQLLYIKLLALCAINNSHTIKMDLKGLMLATRLDNKGIIKGLCLLSRIELIQVLKNGNPYESVSYRTEQNNKEIHKEKKVSQEEKPCSASEPLALTGKKISEPISCGLTLAWNSHCGNLPKVRELSAKRKKQIKLRLSEEPDLEIWTKVIKHIAKLDWCNGRGTRKWFASFDFLLKPDTRIRFLEELENKTGSKNSKVHDAIDELRRRNDEKLFQNN